MGLDGASVNQEGLQYYLLFTCKYCTNRKKKSLSHAAFATKPYGRVHELGFGYQDG